MKLFGKKRADNQLPEERGILTEKVESIFIQLQSGWAGWMSRRTALLTKKEWIAILIVLMTCMGGYSGYLIFCGFTGNAVNTIKAATIRKPAHISKTGEVNNKAGTSDKQYLRIISIRHYLDSLAADPTGKDVYNSIIKKRPGLLDSLRQAENYYKQLKLK